jgi:hypothetical protein
VTQLVAAHKVLELCSRAMETLPDGAPHAEDVRVIYGVAGHVVAADLATPQVQSDARIAVPDWLLIGPSAGTYA